MNVSNEILSSITIYMKYAKYIPETKRRETWDQLVYRNESMHIKKFPNLEKEIKAAYEDVYNKNILPSMRSLQFSGKPIEISPNRIYNCAYLPIESVTAFSETMFLLLGGTGVGYSVQQHHVDKLPSVTVPFQKRTRRFLVMDSIEGWADAIKFCMKSYLGDKRSSRIDFDYSDIRPKGARLVTSGGKAPGPQPLKTCIVKIMGIMDDKKDGDVLTTVEVHDIICHIADSVLAGGIRRAALIALFSSTDSEMIGCKSGDWWEKNPQRGRANNSAVLIRQKLTKKFFLGLWKRIELSGSGEPGFYLSKDKDWGTNPCCFTGDTIVAVADGRNGVSIKELADSKKEFLVYSAREKNTNRLYVSDDYFWGWKTEIKKAIAFHNGYKEIVTIQLSDGSNFRCTDDHLLALPSGDWVEAKDSVGLELEKIFTFSEKNSGKSYRHINSKTNGGSRQYKMISNFLNIDGENINHIDGNATNDLINNLEGISALEHKALTKRHGKDNPIHKCNKELRLLNGSRNSIFANGKRYNWSLSKIEEALKVWDNKNGDKLIELRGPDRNVDLTEDVYVVDVIYTGEKEDVYDLTVEDNHNFYILTKTDDNNYLNSSGVLVHNCEIALRPYQFCNLCEVNASDITNQYEYNRRVKNAAFIGTIQASYTNFHYLRSIWQETTEKDALIGVSMTGIGSGAVLELDMEQAALVVKEENARVAKIIGINPSARTTTVKPAGTTSLTLGTSSGIHAWHNDYYIRRIRVGKNESMYKFLAKNHPELIEDEYFRPHDTAIIGIPQKSPEGSILRTEHPVELLERIKHVSEKWVTPGHIDGANKHNISATISIRDDEWEMIGEWMWQNKEYYNGLSVLPYNGGTYVQAPFEDITKEKYEELMLSLKNVDVSGIEEDGDETDLSGELACGASGCEIQ
jgi:hypothetical protein